MPSFVLDCSVAISWCFGDEQTETALALQERLSDEMAIVPGHWSLEVANVLLMAEKRGRISAIDIDNYLKQLEKLDIVVDDETDIHALTNTFQIARKHKLTSYDAAYLELASRYKIPLATWDKNLTRVATTLRIDCIGQ